MTTANPFATANPAGTESVVSTQDASDEYIFVEDATGKVHAVKRSQVQKTSVQDSPPVVQEVKVEAEFYVWLADMSVERVKESDLPGGHGTNAPEGHWQRGNKVYNVVGVYPVETTVEGK